MLQSQSISALTALPEVAVEVNGAPLASDQIAALTGVRVQQRLSLPTLCELTFSDPPGPLAAAARLAPGDALRVHVTQGPRTQRELLFDGEITALEHVYEPAQGRAIHVRGYDPLHRLRKRQSVRAHAQMTLRDLIQQRVADLDLTVAAVDAGPTWDQLIQYGQTDFDFISELAERCGMYFNVRDRVLHLFTLEGMGEPVDLTLGQSLLEARVDVNSDGTCRQAIASGWNALEMETVEQSAQEPRVGRVVPAASLADARRVGGSGVRRLVQETLPNRQQARALAQAELDRRAAGEVTLWGVVEGHPSLQPGTPVRVHGLADAISGSYVLSLVTHTIDPHTGFLSEISTQPPQRRGGLSPQRAANIAAAPVMAPAVVSRVDDPDRRGRVKVTFSTLENIESGWLHVLMSGAGSGKGLINLPDVGDPVLVLFSRDDPAQAVVLGGVFGATPFTGDDDGVADGRVRRYTLVTRGGQRIRLDDTHNSIRVEDSGGSYVELAPGSMKVHSAGRLEIEAPGQAVVIRGQTIDFEQA